VHVYLSGFTPTKVVHCYSEMVCVNDSPEFSVVRHSPSRKQQIVHNQKRSKMTSPPPPIEFETCLVRLDGQTLRRVVLQDRNGPCPLLAMANVLSLRGECTIPLTNAQLQLTTAEALGNLIATAALEKLQTASELVRDQLIADVLATIPKLRDGMDVNIRFDAPDSHELTPDTTLLDVLNIRMVHGWVADPSCDGPCAVALRSNSYNSLVNGLIELCEQRSPPTPPPSSTAAPPTSATDDAAAPSSETVVQSPSNKADALEEGASASPVSVPTRDSPAPAPPRSKESDGIAVYEREIRDWLQNTATQLTVTGLAALAQCLGEDEFAILFRANHFAVVASRFDTIRQQRMPFLLITDVVLASRGSHWESLEDLDGANTRFLPSLPPLTMAAPPSQQQQQTARPQSAPPARIVHAVPMTRPPVMNSASADAQPQSSARRPTAALPPGSRPPPGPSTARGSPPPRPSSTRTTPPPQRVNDDSICLVA
jgi:hypothetical protein